MKSPNFPIFITFFIILSSLILVVYAVPGIQVTVSTGKLTYSYGELVQIYGDLERDGVLVTNALIAVQISDSRNNIVSIRTRSTGATPSPWSITLTELISCDASGNPRDTFKKGTLAYFKVTVKNLNTVSERYVTVTVNLYDSNQVSFGIAWVGTTVGPNREFTYLCSIPVPSEAPSGTAYAFVNAYNNWPKEKGIAYCAEKTAAFTITDGTSSSSSSSTNSPSTSQAGTYDLTFRLQSKPALGDHIIYASYYQTLATAKFDVFWILSDVSGPRGQRDGVVNLIDVFAVAKAYGSKLGDPSWNSKADVNGDKLVNLLDVYRVARDYGKTMA